VSEPGSQTPYPAQQPAEQEWGSQPTYAGKGSGPRAGFGTRLGAFIIDILILSIPTFIVLVATDQTVANIVSTVLGIVYYTAFEGSATGQTLGKRALGIRVIDFRTGGRLGYGRALLRYIGRILSSIPIFLGYFWMLWDKENQTWHDKIANSVVVPVEAYPVQR
jgi:uncharacterized RDD family membrane protein YckC